jgi:hypothetical protein
MTSPATLEHQSGSPMRGARLPRSRTASGDTSWRDLSAFTRTSTRVITAAAQLDRNLRDAVAAG